MPEQFTADHPTQPRRFRPGPGAVGQRAAGDALKHASKARPARGGPSSSRRGPSGSSNVSLGLPQPRPQEDKPDPQRQVAVNLMHYLNALDLGRDMPYGSWLLRTGHYRSAMAQGQHPLDVFEDLPPGY